MDTSLPLPTSTPTRKLSRTRQWLGGVGALALIGLGIAHTTTNAAGFAAEPNPSWPLFLVFGVGVSVVLWVVAVLVWRYARRGDGRALRRRAPRSTLRVLVAAMGVVCCLMALNVLRVHPELIVSPAGPGPWTLIAGPALVATALLPQRRRTA